MKLALFLALVVTVAAAPSHHQGYRTDQTFPESKDQRVIENVYKSGEQYVYHYKGHVTSGIPKLSGQVAGLHVDCMLTIQFQRDSKVVLKMEKIKLSKINNKITSLPSESPHESELTRLTGEQSDVITRQLVKPIKFRYEQGLVRDVEVDSSDKYWSVNIKKGLLSLFQITLKTSDSLNQDQTITRGRSYGSSRISGGYGSGNQFWKSGTSVQDSVYKVMENDVTGQCETKYTIVSERESTDSPNLHVTAVRNFDNCHHRPSYIQGIFQGVYRHPSERDLLQPTVHTDYVIKGDHAHFLIKEVKLRGQYVFLINGPEGTDMSTHVVQHLILKKTEHISTPTHMSSTKPERLGLTMFIPRSSILTGMDTFEESMTEREGKRFHKNFQTEDYPFGKKDYEKNVDVEDVEDAEERRRYREDGETSRFREEGERNIFGGEEEKGNFREEEGERGRFREEGERRRFREEQEKRGKFSEENENSVVPVIEKKLNDLVQCIYSRSEVTETENTEKFKEGQMFDKFTQSKMFDDIRETPSSDEPKCSEILLQLSSILRETPERDLKVIMSKFFHSHSSSDSTSQSSSDSTSQMNYRKREILEDILSTLSTSNSGKMILELIRDKKVTDVRATVMVQALSLTGKPVPEIIKGLLELYKEARKEVRSHSLNGKTLLHQSLMLAVGTMTNRLTNVLTAEGRPHHEVVNFVGRISTELTKMLEETSSEAERRLILKTMGNMGSSHTIPALTKIIENTEKPIGDRVNAIIALRRIAKQKQHDKQVLPLLLGTYMNPKENTEVRQAAVIVLFGSQPSFSTLQMMAHQIHNEPSSQIRSLVYSCLVNLATQTSYHPHHKMMAKNARLILKTLPPVSVGLQDSMAMSINKFSEKYDLGGVLNIIKIKSKRSALPEALIANLETTLFGKHRRLLEIGAVGKSLETMLRKLFGPYGLMKEIIKGQMSVSDLLKPLNKHDVGQIGQKIRDTINKMMLENENKDEGLSYTSYLKILGHEIQYIVLNSNNIQDLIEKVTSYLPELLNKLSRGLNVDVIKALSYESSLTVASPLGVPLTLNFTTTALFKVDGHIKVNNMPSWSEAINYRHPQQLPKFSVDVDLKPFLDVTRKLTLGADLRWLKTSTGGVMHLKVVHPMKINLHLDSPQHVLTVKHFVPKQSHTSLQASVKPVTSVKFIPLSPNRLPYITEEKEIQGENIVKVTPFENKYTCSPMGMEIETRGSYTLCGPSWFPLAPLRGKQELHVSLRPLSGVDYVQLKIKSLRSNWEYEGVSASQSTDEMFEKDEEELEQEKMFNTRFNTGSNYRTTSKSMIESGDFDQITVDPIFQKDPSKRQILITLGPNNPQIPKLKSLVTWLLGRPSWKSQLNIQVSRQTYGNTPSWKVALDNVINPSVWYPKETPQTRGSQETELITKTKLKWNILGNKNELTVKVNLGSPFDFTSEMREHGIQTVDNLPEATAQKYTYTVEMELPQLTQRTEQYMRRLHDLIKYRFYKKLTTVIPERPYHQNKAYISVQLLPLWEKMNVIVKTPREESFISSVPFNWNPYHTETHGMNLHNVPFSNWFEKSGEDEREWFERSNDKDWSEMMGKSEREYRKNTVPYKTAPLTSNMCSISSSKIRTFDDVTLPLSTEHKHWLKGCTIVFAQDCGGSLFSITGQGEPKNWEFKILLPNLEVGLIRSESQIKTLINGEEKSLHSGDPCVIPKDSSKPLYKIEKISEGVIEVKCYELGLTMTVDNNKIQTHIKLSHGSMLHGQMCGLCGNYNQDQSDDYNVPYDFRYESRDFYDVIKKNLIPSDTCNVAGLKSLRGEQSFEDTCVKKDSHVTVYRSEKGSDMKCTSVNKVPQCSENCRPEGHHSTKVCFTCSTTNNPQSSTNTPRKSYYPPEWEAFTEKGVECEDFYQRVEIPTSCVPVY